MTTRKKTVRKTKNPIITALELKNRKLEEEISRIKCLKQDLEASHERVIVRSRELEEIRINLEHDKRALEAKLVAKEVELKAIKELYNDTLNRLDQKTKNLLKSKGAVKALSERIDKMFADLFDRK